MSVIGVHPEGDINVCTTFYGNPSNGCRSTNGKVDGKKAPFYLTKSSNLSIDGHKEQYLHTHKFQISKELSRATSFKSYGFLQTLIGDATHHEYSPRFSGRHAIPCVNNTGKYGLLSLKCLTLALLYLLS